MTSGTTRATAMGLKFVTRDGLDATVIQLFVRDATSPTLPAHILTVAVVRLVGKDKIVQNVKRTRDAFTAPVINPGNVIVLKAGAEMTAISIWNYAHASNLARTGEYVQIVD